MCNNSQPGQPPQPPWGVGGTRALALLIMYIYIYIYWFIYHWATPRLPQTCSCFILQGSMFSKKNGCIGVLRPLRNSCSPQRRSSQQQPAILGPSGVIHSHSPQHEPSKVPLAAQMLRQTAVGEPLATTLAAPEDMLVSKAMMFFSSPRLFRNILIFLGREWCLKWKLSSDTYITYGRSDMFMGKMRWTLRINNLWHAYSLQGIFPCRKITRG